MRHGYFIAQRKERHGDPEFAQLAEEAWARTGHTTPGRCDGVRVYETDDGPRVTRVTMRDLFALRTVCYPPCAPYTVDQFFVADVAP